jgi:hypothetical protein
MSTDVLKYNTTSLSSDSTRTTLVANKATSDAYDTNITPTLVHTNISTGLNTSYWSKIPKLVNPTGTVLVCNTDATYWRCGASCTWTVPAGVTKVQFELWGAGAGSGGSCCCGLNPYGATGSFASIIIPAVAGCAYTVCAGCAYCCYVSRATHNTQGGESYVQGYGLCNLCAQGGSACQWYRGYEQIYKTCCSACVLINPNCANWNHCYQAGGMCTCNNGTDYCLQGNTSCGLIPAAYVAVNNSSGQYFGYSPQACTRAFGIPSIWPEICWDSNGYGWTKHPPIYGFESVSQCCFQFTGSTAGGWRNSAWCTDYMRIPGAGGSASAVYGGCTSNCGDSGRFGMVRITYC